MDSLKHIIKLIMIGLVATFLASSAYAGDDDEVDLKDCPKAVQKTIKKYAEGGKILEIEMEKEDGEIIYEVEIETSSGDELELYIASNGEVLEIDGENEEDHDDDDDDDDDDDGHKRKRGRR